jgi:hypothetical protein
MAALAFGSRLNDILGAFLDNVGFSFFSVLGFFFAFVFGELFLPFSPALALTEEGQGIIVDDSVDVFLGVAAAFHLLNEFRHG